MQKIQIKALFFLGSILPAYTCLAALDKDFKEAFPDLVQNLCAATIRYELPDFSSHVSFEDRVGEFEKKRVEYHTKINCIVNEAMAGLMQETKKTMKELSETRLASLPDFPALANECKSVFATTQAQQEQFRRSRNQPRTSCDTAGESPSVESPYSACRVTEMVLSEWCGYQKYLWAKAKDDTAFLETSSRVKSVSQLFREVNPVQGTVEKELQKSRQAMQDTLFFYRRFEQNYRFHGFLETMKPIVMTINNKLAMIRGVLNTFPEKFINHQKQ